MGMAFIKISAFGADGLFQTLVKENQVKDPVFSFKLAENGSELTIGGTDENFFTGNFTNVPVTEEVRLDCLLS
jgi:hypothetical protein